MLAGVYSYFLQQATAVAKLGVYLSTRPLLHSLESASLMAR